MQRRIIIFVAGVDIGPGVDEQRHHLGVSEVRRQVQRRPTVLLNRVHIDPRGA